MAKSKTDKIAEALSTSTPRVPAIPDKDLLSTGCTLLNMAFSGRPFGGVPKGSYCYFVGDSGSMKTWASMCLFAEAAINPEFDAYDFVFDNAENGALMDVEKYFGAGVVARLRPPWKKGPGSVTAQDFYYNVEANVRLGPCIYVLDSMDALQDETEEENFEAKLHFHETGKGANEIKGSMGVQKARTNSNYIARIANTTLRSNGSILVVISQTRDKIGARFPTKTRGGGHALKFYAHLEAWTRVLVPMSRTYLRKEREYGAEIEIDVRKNRVCGWEGKIPPLEFIKGHGLDDVGSCVAYLTDERHWTAPPADPKAKKDKRAVLAPDDNEDGPKRFAAPEFDFVGTKEQLVRLIQSQGREPELAEVVAWVWRAIAAGAAPERKPRY